MGPDPLYEMLFVVNCPHGPAKNQIPVPQSIKPVGYCPLSGALTTVKSSKVTIFCVTVSEAVLVPVLFDPEIVTEVDAATALVVTVKVALVPPAATVMLAGTVATPVLLLESVTIAPPLGAGPLSVTVPVDGLPPVTLVGFSASEEIVGAGGVTVSEAV